MFTTKAGAERLGGRACGLDPWQAATLDRPDGTLVNVTALPALHGPPGCEPVMGPVIGFLLEGEGVGTVYVSGDNASLDVVREIAAAACRVDVAISLHFEGWAHFTQGAEQLRAAFAGNGVTDRAVPARARRDAMGLS